MQVGDLQPPRRSDLIERDMRRGGVGQVRIIGDEIKHSAEQNQDDGITTQEPRRVLTGCKNNC